LIKISHMQLSLLYNHFQRGVDKKNKINTMKNMGGDH
jgi:hypothetical protein